MIEKAMLAVKSDSRFLSITLQPESFDPESAVNLNSKLKCVQIDKIC